MRYSSDDIAKLVIHQLSNYWIDLDESMIRASVPEALQEIDKNYQGLPNRHLFDGTEVIFSPYMSVQWMNFLYRLSRILFKRESAAADQVYYLNKIMHSIDWFYAIDLPIHFHCEHPLGSVLGRAQYGDYFFVYQGTTVGGNRTKGQLSYPVIGDNVILFSNASVLGASHIGKNVVVSAGTYIMNQEIPDNSVVFGRSPDLTIKVKSEEEIKRYTQHIWGW